MHFAVANIDVAPWIPPLVAFTISFFTSMGGVSGAFLLLPFQVSVLGFDTPAVSATNQLFNIIAIPGGVYRYFREGRMVWPLTAAVIIGTLPGVLAGTLIRVRYLPQPRNFKFFVGLVLFYIGINMVRDLLHKGREKSKHVQAEKDFQQNVKGASTVGSTVVLRRFSLTRIVYDFNQETFRVNALGIMGLCLVVGVIGGAYGIGGGSIVAPFFITVFGLPVYTIAGPALMGTFVTSVASVIFYQLLAPHYPHLAVAPDWPLGLLFGVGGFAGIYCGARCQKFVPARIIKWILVVCIFIPALKYVWGFLSGLNLG